MKGGEATYHCRFMETPSASQKGRRARDVVPAEERETKYEM